MIRSALHLSHGTIRTPAFLPDATRGLVRSVDSADLEACGVSALIMSTYHLMRRPGSATIKALGGLHRMSGWSRSMATDSGGFQIYSLIRQGRDRGSLTAKGAAFRPEGASRRFVLTPEKSIQLQLAYGSDLLFCLDDCTHPSAPVAEQRESVARTVAWAKRSKTEYAMLVERKQLTEDERPLLFGVIQGGADHDLRRRCADALFEIGFDGYGYGGWPLDESGQLLADVLRLVRELVPIDAPTHALGVAHPLSVARCAAMGYDLFDGAMPTRDARHGRLYAWAGEPERARTPAADEPSWLAYVYVRDDKHTRVDAPVSDGCDCPTCSRYSLGYLHHLFRIGDGLAKRLATMHNLRFMTRLTEILRADDGADC